MYFFKKSNIATSEILSVLSVHPDCFLTLTEITTKNSTPISAYTREHGTRLDDVTL